MKGGIYTEERCPICELQMQDNGRSGLACPDHPKIMARTFIVRFGRKIKKRFSDPGGYGTASRFLNGLRFKTDEGSFDLRDYQPDKPLGFSTLSKRYIEIKELELKRGLAAKGTVKAVRHELTLAASHFGETNVKYIGFTDLQKFLLSIENLSPKSIHNVRTNLHAFWSWLLKGKEIESKDFPEFPEIDFTLGWRKVIDKEIQQAVLEEVRRISEKAPRVYLAIRWLCIYVAIRPGELRGILEKHANLDAGLLMIENHKTVRKTKQPKVVPLLDEDIAILKGLPKSFGGNMPLFRHDQAYNNIKANTPFGQKILYKYWKKACANLGIEGVDLYGGTRHSSMRFYRQHMSTEDVLRLSMHTTSEAGLRYLKIRDEELLKGYSLAVTPGTLSGTPGTRAVHRKPTA